MPYWMNSWRVTPIECATTWPGSVALLVRFCRAVVRLTARPLVIGDPHQTRARSSQFVKEDRHQRLSMMRVSHRGARRYVFSGREMRKHKSRIHAANPCGQTCGPYALSRWSLLIPHNQLKQIGVGANSV